MYTGHSRLKRQSPRNANRQRFGGPDSIPIIAWPDYCLVTSGMEVATDATDKHRLTGEWHAFRTKIAVPDPRPKARRPK
jgi:hypothetical protein